MTVTITDFDLDAGYEVAARMRPVDVRELRDLSGTTPYRAVDEIAGLPGEAWAAWMEGRPIAIFGCVTGWVGRIGTPWLLGTPEMETVPLSIVRHSRKMVERWARSHILLENVVDARNSVSLLWLSHLGFTIEEPIRMTSGAYGRRFWMRGQVSV